MILFLNLQPQNYVQTGPTEQKKEEGRKVGLKQPQTSLLQCHINEGWNMSNQRRNESP